MSPIDTNIEAIVFIKKALRDILIGIHCRNVITLRDVSRFKSDQGVGSLLSRSICMMSRV